ncbi:MAG: O-antigen ligase family protein [Actinomycetota bacterium]
MAQQHHSVRAMKLSPAAELTDAADPLEEKRRRRMEAGLAIVFIVTPLVFMPMSRSPLVDPKVVTLLIGTLMIWAARPSLGRGLATAAAVWVAVLALAGLFGVDWWWSTAGVRNLATGLLLLGPCAYLLVAGASVPREVTRKIPLWSLCTGVAVAVVAIVWRFAPAPLETLFPKLDLEGSTLGHPVFLAGFAAAALVAAVGVAPRRPALFAIALIVVSSSLAISTKRAGWVAVAVGLAVIAWRSKELRRRCAVVGLVVGVTLGVWTGAGAIFGTTELSAAGRFGQLTTSSGRNRILMYQALFRAAIDRPVLGWGPGSTLGAYSASATPEEVRDGDRSAGDAHNILMESLVTSGIVGLSAFAFLIVVTVRRIGRAPPGWAAGAAAALAAFHLFQPMNVALTPLLFLTAGLAAAPAEPADESGRRSIARTSIGVLLGAGILLSMVVFFASAFEQWGRSYNSEWSLRLSRTLAPPRVSSAEALAIHLAIDGRAGDEQAAAEAKEIAAATVAAHPWHPGVRLIAVDVDILVFDSKGAAAWLRDQLRVFPGDAGGLPDAALEFAKTGVLPESTLPEVDNSVPDQ